VWDTHPLTHSPLGECVRVCVLTQRFFKNLWVAAAADSYRNLLSEPKVQRLLLTRD